MSARSRLADDRGYTLPEVLVAIAVGGVVIAATLTLIQISVMAQNNAESRMSSVRDGRGVMNDVARTLRSQIPCIGSPTAEPAVRVAKADEIQLTTAIGGDTSVATDTASAGRWQPIQLRQLNYDATALTLTERVYAGSGAPPATTFPTLTRTRNVGNRLQRVGTAFFKYYAFTASPPYTPTVLMTPTAPGLTLADRQRIARIDINFAVRSRDGDSTAARQATYTERVFTRIADPDSPTTWTACS